MIGDDLVKMRLKYYKLECLLNIKRLCHLNELCVSNLFLCLVQARYFFQQLISGVSYCHYMVSLIKWREHYVLYILCFSFAE